MGTGTTFDGVMGEFGGNGPAAGVDGVVDGVVACDGGMMASAGPEPARPDPRGGSDSTDVPKPRGMKLPSPSFTITPIVEIEWTRIPFGRTLPTLAVVSPM